MTDEELDQEIVAELGPVLAAAQERIKQRQAIT